MRIPTLDGFIDTDTEQDYRKIFEESSEECLYTNELTKGEINAE